MKGIDSVDLIELVVNVPHSEGILVPRILSIAIC